MDEDETKQPPTNDAPDGDNEPTKPEPEVETENTEDSEPTADEDKSADMANRIAALEATVSELAETVAKMREAAGNDIMTPDGDETPEEPDGMDDFNERNGVYMTLDDLYEND